jgi:hypothetical protein
MDTSTPLSISNMSKKELQELLITIQNEIHVIDSKSIYSFSYYYYNEGVKRDQLAKQIEAIELEIMYKADEEQFIKYKPMKDRDPLKRIPRFNRNK